MGANDSLFDRFGSAGAGAVAPYVAPPAPPPLDAGTVTIGPGGRQIGATPTGGAPIAPAPPPNGLPLSPAQRAAILRAHYGGASDESMAYGPGAGPGTGEPPQRYAPVSKVPAAWVPMGRQTQVGVPIDPSVKKGLDDAERLRLQAAQEEEAARKKLAAEQGRAFGTYEVEEEAARTRAKNTGEWNARDLAHRRGEIDRTAGEMRDRKVDPDRYFANQGTLKTIGWVLNGALNGFYAGMHGGRNEGLALMQQMIDRDVDSQKQDIANGRANLEDMRGSYAMAATEYKDDNDRILAARIYARDALQVKLQHAETDAASPLAAARAKQMMADNAKETALMRQQLLQQSANKTSFTEQYKPEHYVGGGPVGGRHSNVASGLVVPIGGGRGVVARSEEEARKIRDRIGARDAIVGNLKRIRDMDAHAGVIERANPYSAYNIERDRLIADTEAKKTVFEQQGAMSKGDQMVTDRALGAIQGTARWFVDTTKTIDGAIQGMNESVDAQIRAQGGPIVQQGWDTDRHGAPVPTNDYVPGAQYQGTPPAAAPTPKGFKP